MEVAMLYLQVFLLIIGVEAALLVLFFYGLRRG